MAHNEAASGGTRVHFGDFVRFTAHRLHAHLVEAWWRVTAIEAGTETLSVVDATGATARVRCAPADEGAAPRLLAGAGAGVSARTCGFADGPGGVVLSTDRRGDMVTANDIRPHR